MLPVPSASRTLRAVGFPPCALMLSAAAAKGRAERWSKAEWVARSVPPGHSCGDQANRVFNNMLYTIAVYGIVASMNKTVKTVSANASRQARFAEKQRLAGKAKLTLWVSTADADAIKTWLRQREEQRNTVELQDNAPFVSVDTLLMPESKKCRTIITISRPESSLLTLQSADFDVILAPTLKALRGFAWKKPLWERKLIDVFTPVDDQIVEISIKLLQAGFPIKIKDEALKIRIINNDYQPSPQRIVSPAISEKYGKKFKLSWGEGDKELWRAINTIPNVKIFNDGAYVPLLQFEALTAITEQFGFLFRPGVDDLLIEAQAEYARAIGLVARPKHHKHADMPNLVKQKPSGEIDAELLDD